MVPDKILQQDKVVLDYHKDTLINNFKSFTTWCLKKFTVTQVNYVPKGEINSQLYLNPWLICQQECNSNEYRASDEENKRISHDVWLLWIEADV